MSPNSAAIHRRPDGALWYTNDASQTRSKQRRWLASAGGFNTACDAVKSAALHRHMSVLPQARGAERGSTGTSAGVAAEVARLSNSRRAPT
eukprot:11118868-Alexandrium_andersonii.AAC.1